MYAYMPAAMSAIEEPAFDGSCVGAGDRDESRFALDQQVVGLLVAVRAVVAVAGDVADDDRRGFAAASAAYDRPRRAAAPGREVLHDDVGLLDDQALQDAPAPPDA